MRIETIGGATLYLGDCMDVLAGLPAGGVDMIWTDPPFGHNNNNSGDLIHRREAALGRGPAGIARPIANDGVKAEGLFLALIAKAPRLLPRGGVCCCCCCGGGPDPMFARWSLAMDGPLQFKQMVVWDKGPMGMGWHYRRSYETVLVAQKRGGKCKWHTNRHNVENIIRPGMEGIRKIIPRATDHPTVKPVQLPAFFISLHSQPGELILDPFMGSGTTGVACTNLNRKFIGVEIEEKYFDIACQRISDAQRKPILLKKRHPNKP